MTVAVRVEGEVITEAAPIVRRFTGQPLRNLVNWMKLRQRGLRIYRLEN